MADNPIFRGRNTGIEAPSSVQEAVSFGLPQAIEGPGNVLDALLKLRMSEQENARQLFETLAKTNPKLAQYVVEAQPGLLKSLVEMPRAIGPSKRKRAAGAPSGSLSEQVLTAAQHAPQPPTERPLEASQRRPFLEFFVPEEATAPNVKLALQFASADDPNVAAAAFEALAKSAPKSFGRAGLAPEAKSIVDKAEILLANGLATNRVDALQKILAQPELKSILLELQIQRSRQVIADAQRQIADGGALDQTNLLRLQDQAQQWQRELADAQKELQTLAENLALAQQMSATGAPMPGFTPPSAEQLAAAKQRASDAQKNLDDVNALLQQARTKTKPGVPAAGSHKSLDDLINEAAKPAP